MATATTFDVNFESSPLGKPPQRLLICHSKKAITIEKLQEKQKLAEERRRVSKDP